MRIRKRLILVSVLLLTSCGLIGNAFTEESVQPVVQQKENIEDKDVCKGKPEYRCRGWNKQELLRLKAENPEEFRKVIKGKKEQVKQRLAELKQADPEKYQRVMGEVKQRCRARLKKLRAENPERFKELMQKCRQLFDQRLEKIKTENPERYQSIMERRKKFQEFKQLRQGDSAKCKGNLKAEPGVCDMQDKQMDKGVSETNVRE